jgi:hypothetical protein
VASKPFDPTLKALVETVPGDWPVFVGTPTGPTEAIDADIATVSGAADKVLRVRAAEQYLLHLDFQSGHDSAMLPRLLDVRNGLLEHRHDLPVRSVAILLRPEADSPALTGERQRGFQGEEAYRRFRYDVLRVWKVPVADMLGGGVGTLPLAPVSNVALEDLPGVIDQMKSRLGRRTIRDQARALWAATFILVGLRYSSEVALRLLQGVVGMKESSTYQMIVEEGRRETHGAALAAQTRKLVLIQGSDRFGAPDERSRQALEEIADLDQLEQLARRVLKAKGWADLLELPAPAAPRPRRKRS